MNLHVIQNAALVTIPNPDQIEAAHLNPRERYALDRILAAGRDRQVQAETKGVEVKSLMVSRISKAQTFVSVEIGYVGDESSALSVFGRTRGTFLIGSRGAIKSCEKGVKGNALIFGWDR